MKAKQLVRLSNIIGVVSILLLIYWVFSFITIEVFGLKVFRANLTESFNMSILGILALMFGALIINIMFNLTRIAQKHNMDDNQVKTGKKAGWILILSFPLILIILFGGDYLTSKQKEKLLVKSAKSIISDNKNKANKLVNYSFNERWIDDTKRILKILSKTDENFPHISIIVNDKVDGSNVYLGFDAYSTTNVNDTLKPEKVDFIQSTNSEEREYLQQVFTKKYDNYRYSSHYGNYELFYPYFEGDKVVVIFFSEYRRYGKIGS